MAETRRNVLGMVPLAALAAGILPARLWASGARSAGAAYRAEPPSPPLREGHAVSGSARLWYWDTGGSGPTVVLLHAGTGNGRVWRYQQQDFVNAGLRVIGYSRRAAAGTEVSGTPDGASDVDDLRALLAHLGIDRFHLVGTAHGSFVAAAFAHDSPGRLKSLVLANSLLGVSGSEIDLMRKNLKIDAIANLPMEMRELGPAYRVGNPAGTERWLDYYHANPPERRAPPSGGLMLEDLRAITTPTLLLAGDADLYAPPPLMEVFTRYLPNSRMLRLPACGHSGYWETPELFNAAVIGFIRNTQRRP